MTRIEFVEALKAQTSDAAVFGTKANLRRPPGRRPRERDLKLSEWYGNLTELDRSMLETTTREAAELAVFSFLCILDCVSAIENGADKGELRLLYSKAGEELFLNDPTADFLHDAYNALCQQFTPNLPQRPESRLYEVGTVSELREHQSSHDALDLHSVTPSLEHPTQTGSTAIALPKNEHRKL